MRLAFVGPFGFHPNKTMRSRALGLARPLASRGHEVKIFMPPWHTPAEADRTWDEEGVAIRYTSLTGGPLGTFLALLKETLAWEPEVVHSFKPKGYSGLVAWWIWRFHHRRIRLVTDTDDWEGRGGWNERAPYTALQKRFFTWQEEWGLAHCHRLTVASRALQALAWARGLPPNQVVYLPNGPGIGANSVGKGDKRRQLGLEGRPVLLLYSRLFEFNTARLVEVLGRVQQSIPEVAVLFIGGGLYEKEAASFRDQLAAGLLEDQLVDAGWVDEELLPDTLAAADIGLYLMEDNLLNRTKCPVKLADMLAVGLPVVAESVGQVPEYVLHQKTGLLRPSGDTDGLAADLIQLLRDGDRRRRMSAAASKHIRENFSWDRLADIAEQAYIEALRP